eukprot:1152485-Pelagomonas_calceolata.AAC.2
MGIRRVTSISPCLVLVTRVERSLLKSASGAKSNPTDPHQHVLFCSFVVEGTLGSFEPMPGYRPLCFRSAALVGGYSNVTLPYLRKWGSGGQKDWAAGLGLACAVNDTFCSYSARTVQNWHGPCRQYSSVWQIFVDQTLVHQESKLRVRTLCQPVPPTPRRERIPKKAKKAQSHVSGMSKAITAYPPLQRGTSAVYNIQVHSVFQAWRSPVLLSCACCST